MLKRLNQVNVKFASSNEWRLPPEQNVERKSASIRWMVTNFQLLSAKSYCLSHFPSHFSVVSSYQTELQSIYVSITSSVPMNLIIYAYVSFPKFVQFRSHLSPNSPELPAISVLLHRPVADLVPSKCWAPACDSSNLSFSGKRSHIPPGETENHRLKSTFGKGDMLVLRRVPQ